MENYRLLTDAYYGSGGFANGEYIVKHRRELPENLTARKNISYYLNYVAPVVNSHVDPIFAKTQVREWEGRNAFVDPFLNDVDGAGTHISQFMKRAALSAKLFGVCYIVLDNARAEDQPQRQNEAVEQRAFPYAYCVFPQDVIKIKHERSGNITLFSIAENESDKKLIRTWTTDGWKLTEAEEDGMIIARGKHGLGVVPVVPLYSRKGLTPVSSAAVQSEFYHIARTNMRIYNLCSELDEILRNQAFSLLIYPSKDPKDLTIGTNNALGFDGTAVRHPPAFIAPPADPATLIMTQIDRLIKEIYRMASLSHATGVQEAKSGVARQWDFQMTNQALADFAKNCEEAEMKLLRLFGRYVREDQGYRASYSSDYSIRETVEYLDNAARALEMDLGALFDSAVKEQVAAVMLQDLPTVDYDGITAQIRDAAGDRTRADYVHNDGSAGIQRQGAFTSLIDLLNGIAAGTISEDAAVVALVGTFGYTEDAAERMVRSQKGVKKIVVE